MSTIFKQLRAIPNLLSLLRILLIPVFVVFYVQAIGSGNFFLPTVILIVSGATDMLDGLIARRFHMITDLGKVLDPIADKLTQVTILFCLMFRYPIFFPLLCILIIKEALMLTGGVLLYRRRIPPSSARWFGKLATCFFYVSTILVVLLPEPDNRLVAATALLNSLFFLFALAKYIPLFFRLKKGGAGTEKNGRPNGRP